MVDHQIIQKKLSIIEESLSYLRKNSQTINAQQLKQDFGLLSAVAHTLQNMIQASSDVCTHICSDEKWELPDNAAHAYRIVLKHQVISTKISEELSLAVKLRNVIVHQYDELDVHILEDVVHHKLHIFTKFIEEIRKWIKE